MYLYFHLLSILVIDAFNGQRGQSKVQEEEQRRLNLIMKDIK